MQTINHDINDDVYEVWEKICANRTPKYRILEAAIIAYAALPKEARDLLFLQDEDDRKLVLDQLHELNLSNAKDKHA